MVLIRRDYKVFEDPDSLLGKKGYRRVYLRITRRIGAT